MTNETQEVSASTASNEAQTSGNKKTVARVKKTTMKLPKAGTIKEIMVLNNEPESRYNTIYQRIQVLVKKGELIESATVKNGDGKGRAEAVYSRPDASPNNNLLRKAASQGRLKSQGVVPTETPAETVVA
jgi:antitoxin component YwqK of YwqJK toxin-antitoxin module